jgi:hypothetical protein
VLALGGSRKNEDISKSGRRRQTRTGALRDRSGLALATVVLYRGKIRKLKPFGLADWGYIKRAKKMAPATLQQVEQVAYFRHHHARVASSPSPIVSGDRLGERESRGAFRR